MKENQTVLGELTKILKEELKKNLNSRYGVREHVSEMELFTLSAQSNRKAHIYLKKVFADFEIEDEAVAIVEKYVENLEKLTEELTNLIVKQLLP